MNIKTLQRTTDEGGSKADWHDWERQIAELEAITHGPERVRQVGGLAMPASALARSGRVVDTGHIAISRSMPEFRR